MSAVPLGQLQSTMCGQAERGGVCRESRPCALGLAWRPAPRAPVARERDDGGGKGATLRGGRGVQAEAAVAHQLPEQERHR